MAEVHLTRVKITSAIANRSTWLALFSLEDRPKLLTKLRSIDVAVNVDSMHGGSADYLFLLAADRESTTGLTRHLSAIDTFPWHLALPYWNAAVRLCGR